MNKTLILALISSITIFGKTFCSAANKPLSNQQEAVKTEFINFVKSKPHFRLVLAIAFSAVKEVQHILEEPEIDVTRTASSSDREKFNAVSESVEFEGVNEINASTFSYAALDFCILQFYAPRYEQLQEREKNALAEIFRLLLAHASTKSLDKTHVANLFQWSVHRDCTSSQPLEILLAYHDSGKLEYNLNEYLPYYDGSTLFLYSLAQSNVQAALILCARKDVDCNVLQKSPAVSSCPRHALHLLARVNVSLECVPLVSQLVVTMLEKGAYIHCLDADNLSPMDRAVFENNTTYLVPIFRSFMGKAHVAQIPKMLNVDVQDCFVQNLWEYPSLDEKEKDAFTKKAGLSLVLGASLTEACRYTQLPPLMILATLGEVKPLRAIMAQHGCPGLDAVIGPCNWRAIHFAAYNGHADTILILLSQSHLPAMPRTASCLTPVALAQISGRAASSDPEHQKKIANVLRIFNELFRRRALIAKILEIQRAVPVLSPDVRKLIAKLYRFDGNEIENNMITLEK